jgi:LacI family transcriptional regulator
MSGRNLALKKPTIKDIAKKLGLAHSTVSMVMNNKGAISDATKTRVHSMAKKLGYEPNLNARALKSGRTNKIAVVIQNFNSAFGTGALAAIEKKIRSRGYDLSVYSENSDMDIFAKILKEKLADAVIVVTVAVEPAVVEAYSAAGVPLVLLEDTVKGRAKFAVLLDNKKAAYDATEYLLKKGCRKIALLSGPGHRTYAAERISGYKLALEDFGVSFDKSIVYEFKNHLFEDGAAAFDYLGKKKYDGVFSAGGDTVAAGFINEAAREGIIIGENIPLVGFDDLPIAKAMGITTIRQPFGEMGLKALDMVLKALDNNDKTGEIFQVIGVLVKRKTA